MKTPEIMAICSLNNTRKRDSWRQHPRSYPTSGRWGGDAENAKTGREKRVRNRPTVRPFLKYF